jgi:hypothetical protein
MKHPRNNIDIHTDEEGLLSVKVNGAEIHLLRRIEIKPFALGGETVILEFDHICNPDTANDRFTV